MTLTWKSEHVDDGEEWINGRRQVAASILHSDRKYVILQDEQEGDRCDLRILVDDEPILVRERVYDGLFAAKWRMEEFEALEIRPCTIHHGPEDDFESPWDEETNYLVDPKESK